MIKLHRRYNAHSSSKSRRKGISDTIDLHGLSGDDAILQLEQFVNDSIMNNIEEIKIIHGKGKGILKKKVIDYLENSELVKDYECGGFAKILKN
ncbi:MAG TPA: Smr/MutS family protein [bacterium]|nr:Smr/MutS family protein [bacterium]